MVAPPYRWQIRVLEKEKERQTRMFDLLEAQCGALREEIDAFRRDAMGQHERFDGVDLLLTLTRRQGVSLCCDSTCPCPQFSRDLERVKLEMVRSLELAHQFDLEGKQVPVGSLRLLHETCL